MTATTRTCTTCLKSRGIDMYPKRNATTCAICERHAERLRGSLPAVLSRPRRVTKAKKAPPKKAKPTNHTTVPTPFGDAIEAGDRLIIEVPVEQFPGWCKAHRHYLKPLPMRSYEYTGPVITD